MWARAVLAVLACVRARDPSLGPPPATSQQPASPPATSPAETGRRAAAPSGVPDHRPSQPRRCWRASALAGRAVSGCCDCGRRRPHIHIDICECVCVCVSHVRMHTHPLRRATDRQSCVWREWPAKRRAANWWMQRAQRRALSAARRYSRRGGHCCMVEMHAHTSYARMYTLHMCVCVCVCVCVYAVRACMDEAFAVSAPCAAIGGMVRGCFRDHNISP